jgi:L-threonylcarbamoyladenylate synthase
MLPDGFPTALVGEATQIFHWGRWEHEVELAQQLYAGLRWLDGVDVTVIVCPLPAARGLGVALRDRLVRAGKQEPGNRE